MNAYQFIPIEWTYQEIFVDGSDPRDRYVGDCEALDITLECDSLSELFAMVPDSIECLIKSFRDEVDLERFALHKEWSPGIKEQMVHLWWQYSQHDKVEPTLLIRAK